MPHKHITGKGATQKKGRGKNTTEHQLSKLSWLNETKWERCNSVKERERETCLDIKTKWILSKIDRYPVVMTKTLYQ